MEKRELEETAVSDSVSGVGKQVRTQGAQKSTPVTSMDSSNERLGVPQRRGEQSGMELVDTPFRLLQILQC